jgi:hypothetical protein
MKKTVKTNVTGKLKKNQNSSAKCKETQILGKIEDVPDLTSSTLPIQKKIGKISAEENYIFYYKDPAEEFMIGTKRNDLLLIAEDSKDIGNKRYLICTFDFLFNRLSTGSYSYYEWINKENPVKLYIDLDLKEEFIKGDRNTELDYYIDRINILVLSVLKKHFKIKQAKCIILKSENNEEKGKASAHLIYPEIIFKNIGMMRSMFFDTKSDLIDNCILDPRAIKSGCFRFLWATKKGKENKLEYYKGIDYKRPKDDKQLFMDCMVCNINKNDTILEYKSEYDKENKPEKPKTKNQILLDKIIQKEDIHTDKLKEIINLIDIEKIKTEKTYYFNWLKIGTAIYNSNNSIEALNIWDEWSKQDDDKYEENICRYKWNSFRNNKTTYDINFLYYLIKKLNPEEYKKIIKIKPEERLFKTTKVNKKYLINMDDIENDDVMKIITNVYYKYKILGILAQYGTGKTKTIIEIMKLFDPTKVLFITHRQTLTFDLFGILKKYLFVNYLDGDFGEDRIICQLESLHKIVANNDSIIPTYDLIVFDESESLLSHFMSTTVKDKRGTFDLLVNLIKQSKRTIAMDGDFGNRTHEFLSSFEKNYTIIENIYKPNKKEFAFTQDTREFNNKIYDDIDNGKNICIVCMSKNIATDYYEKFRYNYEVILHNSDSDDSLKKELNNVNSFWKKYQIIIYSPSITVGVSFDEKHVDNMYVVLAENSCCPRDLLQMVARIRDLKNKKINVHLNAFPFNDKATLYTLKDVEYYIDELHTKNNIDKKTLYDTITKYNYLEELNKNISSFITVFLTLLDKKGHTYTFDNTTYKKSKENKSLFIKESIVNAKDIDEYEYQELLRKQQINNATHNEKLSIERYCYKVNWDVEKIDKKFMDLAYRKTHVLLNLRTIIFGDNENIKTIDEEYLDYYKTKKEERIKIVKDIIKELGYDSYTKKKLINVKTFDENKEKIIKNNILFTDQKFSLPLFNMQKRKISSIKSFMGFINSILKEYGFTISLHRKAEKHTGKTNYYHLEILKEFKNYLIKKKKNVFDQNMFI